jgi:hypothetical protein
MSITMFKTGPYICWETPIHKAPCFACAPARPNLYYRILTKANPTTCNLLGSNPKTKL